MGPWGQGFWDDFVGSQRAKGDQTCVFKYSFACSLPSIPFSAGKSATERCSITGSVPGVVKLVDT